MGEKYTEQISLNYIQASIRHMRIQLVISIILLTVSIPYAAAHPFTMETGPDSSSNVPVGITEVYVIYSESVELDFSSLKIFDNNGNQIDNRDTQYYNDDASLVVSTPPLQEGIYTVQGKVLSKVDGHLVPDAFVFAVGNITLSPSHTDSQTKDVIFLPEAGARFPGLVGQTIVLGSVIASLLIWGTQNKQLISSNIERLNHTYHKRFMSITGIGLILVLASNIIMMAVQALRLESSVIDVIQTTFGSTWMTRMAVTIMLLGVWFWMDRQKQLTRTNQIPMLAISLILIATTTMMGHGAATEQSSAIVLDYIHNLVAAIWIGGLAFFTFALLPAFSGLDEAKRERMSLVMIPRFSIAFVIAVGIVIITGPTLMWLLESNVDIIAESTYGKLIMVKIAIAAIMVGLGGILQFRIQKSAERAINSGSLSIHRKLKGMLKVDVALGVVLLGVVALLANGTLPAGEIQQADAQATAHKLGITEFSENMEFDITIEPFDRGNNYIHIHTSGIDGVPISDLDGIKVKVSNPQKNITPIEIPIEKSENNTEFRGEVTFGFSGEWHMEIEAERTENANETVLLNLPIKPRLDDLKIEIVEHDLPEPAKPLYPMFDGNNSIWISDPSAPRLWKFDMDSGAFESFPFNGVASMWLAKDRTGKIWFTDAPGNQIGFLDPATGNITTIGLPELQPVIYKNTPTFIQSDRNGDIWISITNKYLLLKYDQSHGTFEEVRLPDRESLPFALAADSQGRIWFTESANGRIGYVTPEDNMVREFESDPPLASPEALLFSLDGTVWVSEHTGLAIAKFDPVLETFQRVPVPNTDALPYGMSFDKYGNIWIAQHTVDSIAVYDPDNDSVAEIPIPTESSFVQFTTSDSQQNVWFVEQQANKLAMVKITELPPSPALEPATAAAPDIKYTEIASPLIAMGILATSLFYVKTIKDKRRINELILN